MTELWRACPGYEGLYSISSLGRIRSDAVGTNRRTGQLLKLSPAATGYLRATLVDLDGKRRDGYCHQLVARAFLGDRKGQGLCINHKDNVRSNNCVENLEWCTYSENSYHAVAIGALQSGAKHYKATKVRRTAPDGSVTEFETQTSAAKQLGYQQSGISLACTGKLSTYKGYRWEIAA